MPLHVPPAPAPALRSVLAALDSPTAVREARTPALAVSPSSAQSPATPELALPVHVLCAPTPVAPPAGPRTRLTGWRFLIRSEGRIAAAADTVLTPDGWAFSRFFEGPYLLSTERALHQAESLGPAYQPRLLSVPGLYMLTLWLHTDCTGDGSSGAPADGDLIVPLAPAPPGIAPHRPQHMAELLTALTARLATAPLLAAPA